MIAWTKGSSSRRCLRLTHVQYLFFMLLALSIWSATRIQSSNIWAIDPTENCMDAPEAIHCIHSKNGSENNRTIVSQPHSILKTNATQKNNPDSILLPSSPTTFRHPNFTFDFPLCLVHVGKAAGSSISCSLGLMYANCEGMPRQPALPHTDYFHMRRDNCQKQPTKTFLMTVRNPLTRIASWFDFDKDNLPVRRNKRDEQRLRWKRNMLFDCYETFEDFVRKGLEPIGTITTERPINMTCPERAWAAVLGAREFSYHEWYNYEHYWTALQTRHFHKETSLMVLRREHLLEDWSKLSKEDLYRQVNKGKTNSSIASHSNSTNFWSNLCLAMCPEIRIYQQILQEAQNLNASQVQTSLNEIQRMCPKYNSNPKYSCPGIPEFPPQKVPRREYKAQTKKRLFAIG